MFYFHFSISTSFLSRFLFLMDGPLGNSARAMCIDTKVNGLYIYRFSCGFLAQMRKFYETLTFF